MSYAQSRQDERVRNFQGGMSLREGRKKREENTISIRKNKRRENFSKRRMMAATDQQPQNLPSSAAERLQELSQLVHMIRVGNPEQCYNATFRIRGLLSSEENPPIQDVIDAGVVPRLIEFLTFKDHPRLQFEAAWALTNVASGASDQTRYVLDQGAVPKFRDLLNSPAANVREQAVWALGNIAGDGIHTRDFVLSHNVMKPLLENLATHGNNSMHRNATWTLSNLCRRKPPPDFEKVRPALSMLSRLIYSSDDDVLTDACWTLSYLSDGPKLQIQAVVDAGVCRRLVELMQHPSYAVVTPALRTVGNIVTGDESQTQAMINVSVLATLVSLLKYPRKAVRKEACWAVSNITAGSVDQIQNVINAGIIPPLIQHIKVSDYEVKREAAWALSNATSSGTPQQVRQIVEMGIIPAVFEIFSNPDPSLILVGLGIVDNLLRNGKQFATEQNNFQNPYEMMIYECNEGHKVIEALQDHEDEEVFEKARDIVIAYFQHSEMRNDDAVMPQINSGAFEFGATGGSGTFQF
eukprot:TRINITY_DN312_c0_g1_i1.p1 TRINITY_DN312_c0_g1~~TRINITY_DN312_c0_g1_i1.p1  ORF type:complete len:524 (-),score=139.74 TRINITY_DN312_c0_g1_i1:282-1853(-)